MAKFNIGDKVRVRHYVEGDDDAPSITIGEIGVIYDIDADTVDTSLGYTIVVQFPEAIYGWSEWSYKDEQLELVND